MFFELGCTGRLEMSSFQALSAGKTCMAARILSASGVLNITGSLMAGNGGNGRPLECLPLSCGKAAATARRKTEGDSVMARNIGTLPGIIWRRPGGRGQRWIVGDGRARVKGKGKA